MAEMTIDTTIDKGKGLIIRRVTGLVTVEEAMAAHKKLLTDPDFEKGMSVLWDFSQADMTAVITEDLFHFAELIGQTASARGENYRVALLAQRNLEYGLSRMYESVGEYLPFQMRVFKELKEAMKWLRGEED